MRIVGDPKLSIRTVALLPGSTPIDASLKALPDADVILAGEVREWETPEYVRDTIDMGGKKALVLVGRIVSEGPRHAALRAVDEDARPRGDLHMAAVNRSLLETHSMSTLTASEVVDRMKANHGIPWSERSKRDTFKFGGPDTVVKGIATAMFCSYQLLERAVAAGCNMIIPHEDTYWNDADAIPLVSGDPGYQKKVDFMREHDIVIYRMHDNVHAMGKADFTYIGLARALGITQYETSTLHHFLLPETTLGDLAATFQKRLGDKALRIVGDPKAKMSRLQLGVAMQRPTSTTLA